MLTRRVIDEDQTQQRRLYSPTQQTQGGGPYGGAPQGQVVDPVTGATYASPQAALAAGVTNWKYVGIPAVA